MVSDMRLGRNQNRDMRHKSCLVSRTFGGGRSVVRAGDSTPRSMVAWSMAEKAYYAFMLHAMQHARRRGWRI